MVTRICTTVGFGVATALFNEVAAKPSMGGYYKNDPETQPYSACFWFAAACTAASLIIVPFMTLGTQGGEAKEIETE